MKRRNALIGGTALAAALGTMACTARNAGAQHPGHDHAGHGNDELADAAIDCIRRGNACLAHCIALLGAGDTSVAACATAVEAMKPAMDALAAIAATGNRRTADIARALVKLCEDCEAACRVHADKHPTCRACMESCQRMIAAVAKLA